MEDDLINEYCVLNKIKLNDLDSFNYSYLTQEVRKVVDQIIEDNKETVFDEIEGTLKEINKETNFPFSEVDKNV